MIRTVQRHLEAIYGIECEADAEAFVVDRDMAEALGFAGDREQLLVREEEDGLELGLYLDPALLTRLQQGGDVRRLVVEGDLDGFCQVAEGVSHFLYLSHVAALDRRVSLLELEAQAEVDKFALCLFLRWGEGAKAWGRELIRRLFEAVRYVESLTPELRWRYQEASRLARAYCERLLAHVDAHRLDRLLSELRYSYRLGAEAKLRYLAQTA